MSHRNVDQNIFQTPRGYDMYRKLVQTDQNYQSNELLPLKKTPCIQNFLWQIKILTMWCKMDFVKILLWVFTYVTLPVLPPVQPWYHCFSLNNLKFVRVSSRLIENQCSPGDDSDGSSQKSRWVREWCLLFYGPLYSDQFQSLCTADGRISPLHREHIANQCLKNIYSRDTYIHTLTLYLYRSSRTIVSECFFYLNGAHLLHYKRISRGFATLFLPCTYCHWINYNWFFIPFCDDIYLYNNFSRNNKNCKEIFPSKMDFRYSCGPRDTPNPTTLRKIWMQKFIHKKLQRFSEKFHWKFNAILCLPPKHFGRHCSWKIRQDFDLWDLKNVWSQKICIFW